MQYKNNALLPSSLGKKRKIKKNILHLVFLNTHWNGEFNNMIPKELGAKTGNLFSLTLCPFYFFFSFLFNLL